MNTLGKTLLESGAILAVGVIITGSMLYAFGQNAALFGA